MRRREDAHTKAGWRVHLVFGIDLAGSRFVASGDCVLPSLPSVGSLVAVGADRDLRPAVEEITIWLDAYAGIRLADVEVWDAGTVDRLEREGWRVRPAATSTRISTRCSANCEPCACAWAPPA